MYNRCHNAAIFLVTITIYALNGDDADDEPGKLDW